MIAIQRGVSVPLTWKHGNGSAALIAGTVNKFPTDIKSFMESWRAFLAPEFPLNPDLAESWVLKSEPWLVLEMDREGRKVLDTFSVDWAVPEGKAVPEITINFTYDASSLRELT